MKTIPQITRAEPKIRIPACLSASPKNRKTRALKMSPKATPQKRMMSPSEAIQSLGTASQPPPISRPFSSDHQDLGVGGEEGLGEDVVEGPDPREGDHDRLVDGAPDAGRPARGGHPLVAANDGDDRAEHRRLDDAAPEVGDARVGEEGRPEAGQGL